MTETAAPQAEPWPQSWRPPPEPEPVTLTCPCPRVGRSCAGCILPPMGARPPLRHPAGWVIASIAGPVWRMRGWLWGLIHER
jgi:hypothetical protein